VDCAHNATWLRFRTFVVLPFGQSAELMKERQLDATLQLAVVGATSIHRENSIAGMRLPVNPGAERYYRQVGVIR
jgi:hypothetical protein